MKNEFIQKYQPQLQGVLSFYDRVVIKGTLPDACYADGMRRLMAQKKVLLKDFTQFVQPLRDELRQVAEGLSRQHGVPIEFIRKAKAVRKEDLVSARLAERGTQPGLVCILSVMEQCSTYEYAFDKVKSHSFLRSCSGKCLHYYYYFIDEELGLCYLRVPTWCPFQLQFYFNGHNWLDIQLKKAGIEATLRDNTFTHIAGFDQAQQLCDNFDVAMLHRKLNEFADTYCPVYRRLNPSYHWSLMQVEYATDLVFKDSQTLRPLYEQLITTMTHTVRPDDVLHFLGRKGLHHRNNQPLDTSYKVRQQGSRIKHSMGSSSIKMYDKFAQVLRIETTTNNPTDFSHYRSVEHRDGTKTAKVAPVKKSIYSLKDLAPILGACNKRYLTFLASVDAPVQGKKQLDELSTTTKADNRSYKGFNFFNPEDESLLLNMLRGEFNIKGFRNKDLRKLLPGKNSGQISRLIKRLAVKHLVKKVKGCHRYFLTKLGQKVILTASKLKEFFIIPELSLA